MERLILMNTHREAFEKARYQTQPRDMLMRYNDFSARNKNICIVEGPSDWTFYKNTNIMKLKKCNCNYVWHKGIHARPNPDLDQEFTGKEAVIKTYYEIRDNQDLFPSLNRTFFIVDRDYDDRLILKKKLLSLDDYKCFSITPFHSFECFFLFKENVYKLFEYLNLDKTDVLCFLSVFKKFCGQITEYFALKATIVACYNFCWNRPSYKKGYENEEIFDLKFDSEGNFIYNSRLMDKEVSSMWSSIEYNNQATSYYKETYKELNDNPLFLRGHNLFEFLEKYLDGVHDIIFTHNDREKYELFINQMYVPISIKNGKGIVIYS